MADNTTGLPVQTITGQFVSTKLVDTGGSNVAAVSAAGALSANLVQINGTAHSATAPLFVELSTGAAAYTLFGQTQATAPYNRISDGTNFATIRDLAANDALNVAIVDGSGAHITSFGGGTQYVGDAAATATPTGTIAMGLANAAAPTDVNANNDAVAQWMLRNGSAVTNLASGGTLITIGQKTAANGLPVTLASDQATAAAPLHVVLGTGGADYTLFGQAIGSAPWSRITDGTTTAGVIAGTTALKADISSVAGTATVTGGVSGVQAIGGPVTADAAVSTNNPLILGARVYAAAPADMSADADVGYLWALRNGSLVVNMAAGGTLLTNIGQAAATSKFVRINDGTTTAGVIVGTTALKTDLSSIVGAVPSATNPIPVRPTNGTSFLANLGEAAASGQYVRLTDGTDTAEIITTINSLKVDFSSIVGAVPAATNPIPVRLTDGSSFYSSSSIAPTDPKYSTQTSAALGAGASATVTHYVTSGKTGQLVGIDAGSTVPCKVVINTVLTGTPTARVVLFTKPYEVYQWRAPFKTFITRASGDASSGFSVTFTNKDASIAADVYSTGYWDEV